MSHNPLKETTIKDEPSFHEYDIIFKDTDYTYRIPDGGRDIRMNAINNLIEYDPKFSSETEYIWHFKMDDIVNGETIMQNVRYYKINNRNVIRTRFSGPSPTNETVTWIDENINHLMEKIAKTEMNC